MRRWQTVFTEADLRVLQESGFGVPQKFGKKPALVIIDVTRSFIGSTRQAVAESIKEYKTSCGDAGWVALDSISSLLLACRQRHVPVLFTTADPVIRHFISGATKQSQPTPTVDTNSQDIPESIAPLPSEVVIRKPKASAFFGTPLLAYLQYMGIDTLLIVGTTTSGCVRATVVDAFSHGFTCFVVEEATFDRFELSHLVNLFDMNAKYGTVITLKEALDYVRNLKQ